MLYIDDDDQSLKTSGVRPNDILNIEVSPVVSAISCPWQCSSDRQDKTQEAQIKPKAKKSTDHNSSVLRARSDSPMKRGDPFLPSVFPDENPIADYNVKKSSRKKPSDCKCKGFGYNLSPSALLPEEMRQQWGVGMFGKATLPKPSIISSTNTCALKECEPKCTQANTTRNTNNNCVLRCKNCMRDPCTCTETCSTQQDGFRVPDTSATRKQKHSLKGQIPRSNENNSLGSVLLGNTNNTVLLKKVTSYKGKDSATTINTSNFHRNTPSPLSQNGHSLTATELNGYRCGTASSQSSRGSNRCRGVNGNVSCSTKKFCYTTPEDVNATSRARHRQQPVQPRRHLPNVSSPPVISITGLSMPSSGPLEKSMPMTCGATQMLMMGSQGCACDSCRQRASLMSRMEELGFPTSHAQQILPPFMLGPSQRYQAASLRSALTTSGRYAPYNIPTYGYGQTSSTVYSSPERYQCKSPPMYDYADSPGLKRQPIASTLLSMAQELSKVETSYQDNENPTSPQFLGFGEDITDMSIKETVDFFVSMKSPFVKFSSMTSSDACPGMCSSLCQEEQCLSPPNYNNCSSWYCTTGGCGSSYPMSPVRRESIYRESVPQKFDIADGQNPTMSLLYSTLVSDLEDELRCAIENIPTS